MLKEKNKKVVVAISGGVDSAVTALLLKKQGFQVIGVFMRLGDHSIAGEQAARAVCAHLGIKFFPVNISRKFEKEVVDYFVESYSKGLTPNPCVKCNKLIKFGELLRVANELDADFLATGHYIKKLEIRPAGNTSRRKYPRGEKSKISYKLFKGEDEKKDQSYFLYNLTREQLTKILFPLGDFKKEEIKKIAKEAKIPNQPSESQDICFMMKDGKILNHNDFLKDHIKARPGDILDMNGKVIGRHKGLPFYTIGQRKGIEIGGIGPFYAVKMDYKKNVLYVTDKSNDKNLYRDELVAENVNWISGKIPKMPCKCAAMIRYRHKAEDCEITHDNGEYQVKFKNKQRAVTSGQSVVFYRKEELLGGGLII